MTEERGREGDLSPAPTYMPGIANPWLGPLLSKEMMERPADEDGAWKKNEGIPEPGWSMKKGDDE